MTTDIREVIGSPFEQGVEEEIPYPLTIPATWGTPTGTPTVKVYSYIGGEYADVTETVTTGTVSLSGQVITLPIIKSLTDGVRYRVEVKFSRSEGGKLEAYAWIDARR